MPSLEADAGYASQVFAAKALVHPAVGSGGRLQGSFQPRCRLDMRWESGKETIWSVHGGRLEDGVGGPGVADMLLRCAAGLVISYWSIVIQSLRLSSLCYFDLRHSLLDIRHSVGGSRDSTNRRGHSVWDQNTSRNQFFSEKRGVSIISRSAARCSMSGCCRRLWVAARKLLR
jgi:hypothetical protein